MQYPIERPELVEQALSLASELGFAARPEGNRPDEAGGASCCIDSVGSLLQTICSSLDCAKVGEIGTGAGVGTAWLAAGLSPRSSLTSVEIDKGLHEAVSKLFRSHESVKLLNDDWRGEFKSQSPYDLLFADGGGVGNTQSSGWEEIANLVCTRGIIVIDDLTPEELWPPSWRGKPDPKRELAFNSGYFMSTEIRTSSETSALIMVRR
ncbi:MAG: O-methyltransferase [bacterium]